MVALGMITSQEEVVALPSVRVTMRKTKEILRLRFDLGRSYHEIATSCQVSTSTVWEALSRFKASGLPWPLPAGMDDLMLERRLYHHEPPPSTRPVPDWTQVYQELRRSDVHMTLVLLWEEYKLTHPDGYGYSWFCHQYEKWRGGLDLVMRQEHKQGEKCFVDYAGDKVPVVDPHTGEIRPAQLFVGALGASNYTYAEAVWTQEIESWINSHLRMFQYFGALPRVLVPDNLKSGVTKPDYYEPDINPVYLDMADHYEIAVIPARSGKPRDKAKVENAVLVAERWILARLRKRTFFGLEELNCAIRELREELNRRPFKKLPGCRRQLFEEQERPAMRPLPAEPYVFSHIKKARVHPDYHIEVTSHFYSVPFTLVKKEVEVHFNAATVEVYHAGVRVASHRRSFKPGHTTLPEHMPPHHRALAQWTPERIAAWAAKVGPCAEKTVTEIMARRQHPEQGFRACMGLLHLAKKHGNQELEAACTRAVALGSFSYKSVKSILASGLYRQPLPAQLTMPLPTAGYHENVRGSGYYN